MLEFCGATVRLRSRPELMATRYHPIHDQLGYAKSLSKEASRRGKGSMGYGAGVFWQTILFPLFIRLNLNHLNSLKPFTILFPLFV